MPRNTLLTSPPPYDQWRCICGRVYGGNRRICAKIVCGASRAQAEEKLAREDQFDLEIDLMRRLETGVFND